MKKKWYENSFIISVLLILFFPMGLFLMWKYANWAKAFKWIITTIIILIVLNSVFSSKNPEDTTNKPATLPEQQDQVQEQEQAVNSDTTQTDTTASPTLVEVPAKVTNTPAPIQAKQTENQITSNETISQKNAIKKAKSYLDFTGFSHDGLIAQLEYEKFSQADAVYGADNSGANWNEQAAKKAKAYMDYSAFSRGSLIEQLKYDKFTQEQAEYGANSVGL